MPSADRPSWLRRCAWLFLFVPATLFLFAAQIQQPVDPSNQALKAPDSRDAANLRALGDVVPDDQVVLLGFAVPGHLAILPADLERIAACRSHLLGLPGVADCRVPPSPEPGLALLAVSLRGSDVGRIAHDVVAAARAEAPPSLQVLATGLPLVEATIARFVAAERTQIVPLLVLTLLATAMLVYRHWGLGLAALLPALAGIAWTGGIIALRGHPLDPIAALLDPVLLTIGVASSVHFVESWCRGRTDGLDAHDAAQFACREQYQPAFQATVTTMIGLLALTTSQVPAVFDFGVRAALGVALVHAFTFAILPAWLPLAAGAYQPRAVPAARAGYWLHRLHHFRTPILAATAAATVLALAGLPALRTDNDPLTMLPPKDQCRVDHDQLAARLGGVETFHFLVPHGSPGTEPSRLLPFLAAAQLQAGVAGLAGPVQRGENGDLAAPLLLQPAGSAVREPLFANLERAARVLGLDGLVPAGASVQIARDSAALMQSPLRSLGITLVLLAVVMCIGLRSLRLGLLGMVPNLLPCVWIYGAIAWLDHPISVATAMIGATMLGLIVDNTLHLLHHYRRERSGASRRLAVQRALQHCGRAMWLSSALLVVGFATAATSRLETTVEFSLLACTTIVVALFGDGVLLPMLLGTPAPAHTDTPGVATHVL